VLTKNNYKQIKSKESTTMSVVIVGGNERMEGQYSDICRNYGCTAKIFTKENGSLRKKIGSPDLLILFTGTVSHKMVISAAQEAKRIHVPIVRIHTSSAAALTQVLADAMPRFSACNI
jgi:hypothetical protein